MAFPRASAIRGDAAVGAVRPAAEGLSTPRSVIGAVDAHYPVRRPEAIQCPHCDEVAMPNLLSGGSYICSCTAERALPLKR